MDKIANCIGKTKYTRDDLKMKLHEFQIPFKTNDKKAVLVAKLNSYLSEEIPTEPNIQNKPKYIKKPIRKALRIAVWNKYIGCDKRKGLCHICKEEISLEMFECGHVVAESTGGETSLENLRPLCSLCNKSMQATNLNKFQSDYNKIISNNDDQNDYCLISLFVLTISFFMIFYYNRFCPVLI